MRQRDVTFRHASLAPRSGERGEDPRRDPALAQTQRAVVDHDIGLAAVEETRARRRARHIEKHQHGADHYTEQQQGHCKSPTVTQRSATDPHGFVAAGAGCVQMPTCASIDRRNALMHAQGSATMSTTANIVRVSTMLIEVTSRLPSPVGAAIISPTRTAPTATRNAVRAASTTLGASGAPAVAAGGMPGAAGPAGSREVISPLTTAKPAA